MKIDARLDLYGRQGPDPWDEAYGIQLPLDHIICRDIDGTPHKVREFKWPWTAYTKNQQRFVLHFYYWNQTRGRIPKDNPNVSPEREARIRTLQFLMTRQIFYGNDNAPTTLAGKLRTLTYLARFAETQACTIHDVFMETSLLDACGASLPDAFIPGWMSWINFLRNLDSVAQLGFTLAKPRRWKDIERRAKNVRENASQHAPVPTRIYAGFINNLATELDDIEAHAPLLLAALREGLVLHAKAKAKAMQKGHRISIGQALIEKHGLADYLVRRGFSIEAKALNTLSAAVTEIFQVCKLQIHVFTASTPWPAWWYSARN